MGLLNKGGNIRVRLKFSSETVKNLGKSLTPAIKKASSYIELVIRVIKKHPIEVAAGVVGTGLVVDDLRQRSEKHNLEKNMLKTKEVLKKHEVEIRTLSAVAEKAKSLEIINEQLCDVIRTQREESDEEKNKDKTTD